MKGNSNWIKQWGLRQYISIISAMMIALNTILPAAPVFAEESTSSDTAVESSASESAPAESSADTSSDSDSSEASDSSSDSTSDSTSDSSDESANSDEWDSADTGSQTASNEDDWASIEESTENSDGDQSSATEAVTSEDEDNTSEWSEEKDNSTDQSWQNGDEVVDDDTASNIETPMDSHVADDSQNDEWKASEWQENDSEWQEDDSELQENTEPEYNPAFDIEKIINDLNLNKEKRVAIVAKKLWIDWNKENWEYAKLSWIEKYVGSLEQNMTIRNYLIANAAEIYKEKNGWNEWDTLALTENEKVEEVKLNVEPITWEATYNWVTVNVTAPAGSFPAGTRLVIKSLWDEEATTTLDIWMKELQLAQQIEEVDYDTPMVSFDISFFAADDFEMVNELQPAEWKTVEVTFDYAQNDDLKKADESSDQEIKVYHLDDKDEVWNYSEELKIEEVEIVKNEEWIIAVEAESFSTWTVVVTRPGEENNIESYWYNDLISAINNEQTKEWDTVEIKADIDLMGNVKINKSINIDLWWHKINANGHRFYFDWNITSEISNWTITNTSNPAIQIQNWANVMITNWTYTSNWNSIQIVGSNLTVNNATITSENGSWIAWYNGSEILINNANITAQEVAVYITNASKVTINDWTYITRDNFVVWTNWSTWQWWNTITINWWTFNGNIQSAWYVACGIYAPNDDTITVNWWTFNITNWVWVAVRAWQVEITENAKFVVSWEHTTTWKVWDSRVVVPAGTKVVVDTAAGYPGLNNDFKVISKKNSEEATEAPNMTQLYIIESETEDGKTTFADADNIELTNTESDKKKIEIVSWTFSNTSCPTNLSVADWYMLEMDGGSCKVKEVVAKIWETGYSSLKAAFTAINEGNYTETPEIILQRDYLVESTDDNRLTANKPLILNLNDNEFTIWYVWSCYWALQWFITANANITIKNGKIIDKTRWQCTNLAIINYGKVMNLENLMINWTERYNWMYPEVMSVGWSLNIIDTTITAGNDFCVEVTTQWNLTIKWNSKFSYKYNDTTHERKDGHNGAINVHDGSKATISEWNITLNGNYLFNITNDPKNILNSITIGSCTPELIAANNNTCVDKKPTFNKKPEDSWIADWHTIESDWDNWKVVYDPVAEVYDGETLKWWYSSLGNAINAVSNDGDIVRLKKDTTINDALWTKNKDKKFTLDLNREKIVINYKDSNDLHGLAFENCNDVTIKNGEIIGDGPANSYIIYIKNNAKITLWEGLVAKLSSNKCASAMMRLWDNATLEIKDWEFEAKKDCKSMLQTQTNARTKIISGKFHSDGKLFSLINIDSWIIPIEITGGEFNKDPSAHVENNYYVVAKNGTYVVVGDNNGTPNIPTDFTDYVYLAKPSANVINPAWATVDVNENTWIGEDTIKTDSINIEHLNNTVQTNILWEVILTYTNAANNAAVSTVEFSTPIKLRIPVKGDAQKVMILANHGNWFWTDWLTLNSNTSCANWEAADDDKYNWNYIDVEDKYATIYTCKASTFVAVDGLYYATLDSNGADVEWTPYVYYKYGVDSYYESAKAEYTDSEKLDVDETKAGIQIEVPYKKWVEFLWYFDESTATPTKVIDADGTILPAFNTDSNKTYTAHYNNGEYVFYDFSIDVTDKGTATAWSSNQWWRKYWETITLVAPTVKEGIEDAEKYEFKWWDFSDWANASLSIDLNCTEDNATCTFTMPDSDVVAIANIWKKEFTITWLDDDGSELKSEKVALDEIPNYGENPATKPADNQCSAHPFKGWTTLDDENVLEIIPAVTWEATYKASYNCTPLNTYTITWKDGDTILKTEEITEGQIPSYNWTPVKPSDAENDYTFIGWSDENTQYAKDAILPAATADATYTATFSGTKRKYTIKFANYDGSILQQSDIEYGTTPTAPTTNPSKPETAQYNYEFKGWSPAITDETKVTGEATYTAQFTETTRKYEIKFVKEDWTTALKTINVAYGSTPIYDWETPTKENSDGKMYTFDGWTRWTNNSSIINPNNLPPVVWEETYKAHFAESDIQYTVTFDTKGWDAVEAQTVNASNPTITLPAATRKWYILAGWCETDDANCTVISNNNQYPVNGNKTLYAKWTPGNVSYSIIHYTINGTNNDKKLESEWSAKAGYIVDETFINNNIVKQTYLGYDFKECKSDDTVIKWDWSTVIKCYYEKKADLTVKFNSDGGTNVEDQTVEYNAKVSEPTAPTKEGYTFNGWKKDNAVYNFATPVTENITLIADWTINWFTITFDTDGGTTIDAITQDYGTDITAPADPTKGGYSFAGWDETIPATMPAENLTIKAQWTVNQYTITFDTDGWTTIDAITQDYGTDITAPADPTKDGFTFAGWDETIPATMPAENVTVKANWNKNIDSNTSIKASVASEGKENKNQGKYNLAVKQDWENIVVTIKDDGLEKFDNDATPYEWKWVWLIVDFGAPVVWKSNYTIEDIDRADAHLYGGESSSETDFILWISENKSGLPLTFKNQNVDGDTKTITVEFKNTVTWKNEDWTTLATDTVDYGSHPSYNGPTPKKSDPAYVYELLWWYVKWDESQNVVNLENETVTSNITYVAKYNESASDDRAYTVTWNYKDADGTEKTETAEVNYNTVPTTPTLPESSQSESTIYTFEWWLAWNETENVITEIPAIRWDTTYTAKYAEEARGYTITWNYKDANGNDLSDTTQVAYNTAPTHDTPSTYKVNGWNQNFAWWMDDNTTYAKDASLPKVTWEATYTATYSQSTIDYTITYNPDNWSNNTIVNRRKNDTITPIADPTKDGYDFAGWEPVLPDVMPAEDLTVVAQWTPKTYTVTFDVNGWYALDNEKATQQVTYKSEYWELPTPKYENRTFLGWFTAAEWWDEVKTDSIYELTNDQTLYAHWGARKYTINFDSNWWEWEMTSIEFVCGNNTTVPESTFTKEWYTFKWWSFNASNWGKHYDDQWIIGCDTKKTEATFYAQWEISQYTITFDTDGWTEIAPITQNFGTDITAPNNPTKDGYDFAGWDTEIPITMPAENLTIKTIWKSTTWDAFVIHALPVKIWDQEIKEQSKENGWDGTYSSADGDYTVAIDETNKTITFSNITLKDPGTAENENGTRPAGKIWFWVRFVLPEAASTASTIQINGKEPAHLDDEDISKGYVDAWLGIDADQVEEIVSDATKENKITWTFNVSWNGVLDNAETYTVVADLNDVTVEDNNWNPVIVVANGTIKASTVTFNANYDWAPTIEAQTVAYKWKATVPEISRDGYSVKWFNWETEYDFDSEVTTDVSLKAQWTPVDYTITYNLDGGSVAKENPTTYTIESATITLVNPTREWFRFDGWTSDNITEPSTEVTIVNWSTWDKSFTAKWTGTTWDAFVIHALPVEVNGEAIYEQSKANGWNNTYSSADGDYTVAIDDTSKTITFSNITLKDPGPAENENGTRPAGKIWFWVRFVNPEAASTASTIQINDKEPAHLDNDDITNWFVDAWLGIDADHVKDIVSDEDPENKKEWTFKVSWNGTETETYTVIADLSDVTVEDEKGNPIFDVNPDNDIIIDKTENSVTFNANYEWATNPATQPVKYGEKATAPEISRDGYTFEGWFAEWSETAYDFETPVKDNITLTAKWTAKKFTITFKLADGETIDETAIPADSWITVNKDADWKITSIIKEVTYDQPYWDLPTPAKSWSTFNSWKAWNTSVNKDSKVAITADTELKADWKSNSWGWGSSWGWSGGGSSSGWSGSWGWGGWSSKTTTPSTPTTGDVQNDTQDDTDNNKSDSSNEDKPYAPTTADIEKYGQNVADTYTWARDNWITTIDDINKAKLYTPITRWELAKMMVQFSANVLWKKPVKSENVTYQDVNSDNVFNDYIKLAYQYQIMGINTDGTPIKNFKPNKRITRAEFATVLSRVLYGLTYNKYWNDYYANHIQALKNAGILTNTNPSMEELRLYVMLMLQRAQNVEWIDNPISNIVNPGSDNAAEDSTIEETNKVSNVYIPNAADIQKYGEDLAKVYQWAEENWVIPSKDINKANLNLEISREEIAEIMVNYAINILWRQATLTGNANYQDVTASDSKYIQLAYQYQIMGVDVNWNPTKKFNPKKLVNRWEFGTIFSRVLFGATYNLNWTNYYVNHLNALNKANIITNINPNLKERKRYILTILYNARNFK